MPTPSSPTVMGVDAFALKRGQVYGTVFVDHHSHHVIDLIPERSSESTTAWMRRHDSIALVTRDRSSLYAKGIREAHPRAIQVADRWHLLANSREAMVRLLDRHHREIHAAQTSVAVESLKPVIPAEVSNELPMEEPDRAALSKPLSKAMQDSLHRRERRLEKYQQVLLLREQKLGIRAICREMGMSRRTVKRFLAAGAFPEQAKRHMRKSIDRFAQRIRQWWDQGIHNARELHRLAAAEGFRGSWYCVRRLVAAWRDPAERCSGIKPLRRVKTALARISSMRLSWLLLKEDIHRSAEEEATITKLIGEVPAIRAAWHLGRAFCSAVKARDIEKLKSWLCEAIGAATPHELRRFGIGLQQDWPEVGAAMEFHWNNGRAEGHVNRIKLIKRKMYGRAKFDLLRIRVLASGP